MIKFKSALLTGLMLAMPATAVAQIPVTDGAQVGQNFTNLAHQLSQIQHMLTQIAELRNQLTQLQKQTEALTGDYNLSDLANSSIFKELRRLETDLDGYLNIADGSGTGPIAELGRQALESYGIVSGAELFRSQNSTTANPLQVSHDQSRNVIAAGAGTARAIMAGSDRRIDVYEAFIDEIDTTPNAKASSDLAARIAAENGLLMNEMLRMQAMNLELQQTLLARELASDQADTNFFKSEEPTP